jgi:hypothetical protein
MTSDKPVADQSANTIADPHRTKPWTHAFEAFRELLVVQHYQKRKISTNKQAKQKQQKAIIHKISGNLIFWHRIAHLRRLQIHHQLQLQCGIENIDQSQQAGKQNKSN